MCTEFGYPRLTEREVLSIYMARENGVFNNLDPIAVWMNNAFLREQTNDEPIDAVAESVDVPTTPPPVVTVKLKPGMLAARQLLMNKYKARAKS